MSASPAAAAVGGVTRRLTDRPTWRLLEAGGAAVAAKASAGKK